MLLTPYNFLRWYNAATPPIPLPRASEANHPCDSALVWAVGENYRFYVNRSDRQPLPAGAQLINEKGQALAVALVKYDFPITGGQHSYIEVTVPNVPEGMYYLKAGNLTSSRFLITTAEEANTFTVLMDFRQVELFAKTPNLFFWPYLDNYRNNSESSQRFRIRIVAGPESMNGEMEVYEQSSNGQTRLIGGTEKVILQFMGYEWNDEDIRALRMAIKHDNLTLNGEPFKYYNQGNIQVSYDYGESSRGITFSLERMNETLLIRC